MPTMYEYLNQIKTPDYTNLTQTPSLAGFIDSYKPNIDSYRPSNVNTGLLASSLGNNAIPLPDANAVLSYKAPTLTQSLGDFMKRINPLGNSSRTNPVADAGKDTNWSNMAFSNKLGFGIGALSSALDAISAHRAYKLGKSQLNFQKDQFNRQFDAQKGLTNSQLYDRQTIRNIQNPGMFMSASEYLDKYGVK